MFVLKDAILPRANARFQQQRALTVGGIIGLAYVGLSISQYFIVFRAVTTVSAFRFVTTLMAGMTMGVYMTIFGPKCAKVVIGISGALLTLTDFPVIWAVWRHQVTQPVITIPGFSVVNGSLLGVAGALAVFLWLRMAKTTKERLASSTGLPPS